MNQSLIKILSYVSIPVIITVGTIIYKAGQKDGSGKVTDEVILKEVKELRQYTETEVGGLKGSFNRMECRMDSMIVIVQSSEVNDKDRYSLIQKEIDILIKQDKSGEALKAINEWREWYQERYEVQLIEKKNLTPLKLGFAKNNN